MKKNKVLSFLLMFGLVVALTACNNGDEYPYESTPETEVGYEEDNNLTDDDNVANEDDNVANFEVLYAMTSELLYDLENINLEEIDAFKATLEDAVSIASTVVSNEQLSQLTRDLAGVVHELTLGHLQSFHDFSDEITIDVLTELQPILIDNIQGIHAQFQLTN